MEAAVLGQESACHRRIRKEASDWNLHSRGEGYTRGRKARRWSRAKVKWEMSVQGCQGRAGMLPTALPFDRSAAVYDRVVRLGPRGGTRGGFHHVRDGPRRGGLLMRNAAMAAHRRLHSASPSRANAPMHRSRHRVTAHRWSATSSLWPPIRSVYARPSLDSDAPMGACLF